MSPVALLLIAGLTLVAAPHLRAQELMKSGQRETTITAQGKPLVSTRCFIPAEVKDRNSGPAVSVHPLKRLRATLRHTIGWLPQGSCAKRRNGGKAGHPPFQL